MKRLQARRTSWPAIRSTAPQRGASRSSTSRRNGSWLVFAIRPGSVDLLAWSGVTYDVSVASVEREAAPVEVPERLRRGKHDSGEEWLESGLFAVELLRRTVAPRNLA